MKGSEALICHIQIVSERYDDRCGGGMKEFFLASAETALKEVLKLEEGGFETRGTYTDRNVKIEFLYSRDRGHWVKLYDYWYDEFSRAPHGFSPSGEDSLDYVKIKKQLQRLRELASGFDDEP